MRSQIDYRFVLPNSREFDELQSFARSFDHEIQPHPSKSVYAHYSEGVLFGYSDHVYLPTVYPAFHPKYTKPKNVIQVMSDWKAHCQLSGKVGYIGVPFDNNNGIGNFPEEIMSKLGLIRLNREIYAPE